MSGSILPVTRLRGGHEFLAEVPGTEETVVATVQSVRFTVEGHMGRTPVAKVAVSYGLAGAKHDAEWTFRRDAKLQLLGVN